MMLIEETSVPQAALPLALFKEHLRLGSGFTDDGLQDGLLESFLRAALAAIEARTGKALIEREFTLQVAQWRDPEGLRLPVAPVSAIVELALVDRVGVASVQPADSVRLVPDLHVPCIVPSAGLLPAIPSGGSARLRFLSGFGPDWSDLPADLAQAVMLLAAHYYEYRHEMQYDGACMPFGVSALTERYKTPRFGGGRV